MIYIGGISIFEGVDGIGKSTIIKTNFDDNNPSIKIEHLSWSKAIDRCSREYQVFTIENAIKEAFAGNHIILDRSYLSEYIYSGVYRPENNYNAWKIYMHCEKLLADVSNEIFVNKYVVYSDKTTWISRYNSGIAEGKSELFNMDHKLQLVYDKYEQFMKNSNSNSWEFWIN